MHRFFTELPYEVITPKAFRTSPMHQQESDFLDCEGLRRLCEAAIGPLLSAACSGGGFETDLCF